MMPKKTTARESASNSSKRARFERAAERRVAEALRRLRLVGKLANRHNYEYTDEHVQQIFDALDTELRQLKQRFQQEDAEGTPTFSFKP